MSAQPTCEYCAGSPPPLGPLSTADWNRLKAALEGGSFALAAGEARLAFSCGEAEAIAWLEHLLACPRSWVFSARETRALDRIDRAFAEVAKPAHFTEFDHCDECQEHDDVLRNNTRDTISRKSFGTCGWSPIGFCSPAGLRYYFPALARYALLPNMLHCHGLTDMFLSAIGPERQGKPLAELCSAAQRSAVVAYLDCMPEFAEVEAPLRDARNLWRLSLA